jgi:hypothetical protein
MEPDETQQKVLAWGVPDGPYLHSDYCEDDSCKFEEAWVVAKCSIPDSSEVFDVELFFPDFNSAYAFMRELNNMNEPMEIVL